MNSGNGWQRGRTSPGWCVQTNKRREDETKIKERMRREGKRREEKAGGESRKEKGRMRGKKQEKSDGNR